MSLSEQTARVAGGGKSALKTILQKLGVAVGDESIDQYAALAAGISRKLLPDKLVSANTAQQHGKDSSAVVDDILYVLRESVIRRNGVLQTILGTELKFLSVETGTYTGTGTYGSNNPTKITFSKKNQLFGV